MWMDRVALRFGERNNVWILSSCLLLFFSTLTAKEQKISRITHGERVGVYGWKDRKSVV